MPKRRVTKRAVSEELYDQVNGLVDTYGSPSQVMRALAEVARNIGHDIDDDMKELARQEGRRRTREERAESEWFRKYAQDVAEFARKMRKREAEFWS